MDDLIDLDVPAANAIGVWHDLERALAGKNGYGGDTAEIYAYRIVAQHLRDRADPTFITGASDAEGEAAKAELGRVAGANMTHLLRHFLDLHEDALISIEDRDGFRPLDLDVEECPPFDWRIHLRVSQAPLHTPALAIHELREILAETVEGTKALSAMIDELVQLRAKDRLRAEALPPDEAADLPPDAATGLYLDRPFDVDDLTWIAQALGSRTDGGAARYAQLMLVFEAIRRDDRAAAEFLRVMNTIVLPICRRLRLQRQPHLTKIGAAE
jgi:hypothetical protein